MYVLIQETSPLIIPGFQWSRVKNIKQNFRCNISANTWFHPNCYFFHFRAQIHWFVFFNSIIFMSSFYLDMSFWRFNAILKRDNTFGNMFVNLIFSFKFSLWGSRKGSHCINSNTWAIKTDVNMVIGKRIKQNVEQQSTWLCYNLNH